MNLRNMQDLLCFVILSLRRICSVSWGRFLLRRNDKRGSFSFREILQEKASSQRSSNERHFIFTIQFCQNSFKYDLPVFVFRIELIGKYWHIHDSSFSIPSFCYFLDPGCCFLRCPQLRLPTHVGIPQEILIPFVIIKGFPTMDENKITHRSYFLRQI